MNKAEAECYSIMIEAIAQIASVIQDHSETSANINRVLDEMERMLKVLRSSHDSDN